MEYRSATTDRPHQVSARSAMRGKTAFALLAEMRTGKTKVIIDDWGEAVLRGDVKDLAVVAPSGSYKTWAGEIQKHLMIEMQDSVIVGTWESGNEKKASKLRSMSEDHRFPRVLIVNIEALSVDTEARTILTRVVEQGEAELVVDESTKIKNDSIRTKWLCDLAPRAKRRRIMSGLVSPRSPLDVFWQYWFLDRRILGFATFQGFMVAFSIIRKRNVWVEKAGRRLRRTAIQVVGYKNVERIHQLIAPHSYRVLLSDCSDVPPKQYVTIDVELTPEQKKHYAELSTYATTRIEGNQYASATETIVLALRLHQLCCGRLVSEDGTEHGVPTNRLNALLDYVSDRSGKKIIWCSYRPDVLAVSAALRTEYGDAAVACFWGGNAGTREEDSRRFKEDPSCEFMVATPDSGGMGRTWPEARYMIFYSNRDNLEHRLQAEERGTDVTKVDPVIVADFVTRRTVEEKIVESMKKKWELSKIVNGENWREWLTNGG